MSTIAFTWTAGKPPAPDVYTTRRNKSKYLTPRYWDGTAWFDIAYGASRGSKSWAWPKKSRTRRPEWVTHVEKQVGSLYLRTIRVHQDAIEWGEPYKVFKEREVLAHLVKTGILPADWKTAYQAEMRGCAA